MTGPVAALPGESGGTASTATARRGVVAVTGGLVVVGLASYGFLTLAARTLHPAQFSAVAALWSLLYGLAGGLFLPLEQETTRQVAQRVVRGERVGPVVTKVIRLGAVLLAVLLGALLLARRPLTDAIFGGNQGMVLALCLALTGMIGLYITRGLLAGTSSFVRYAGQLGGEGVLRFAMTVGVVVAGAATTSRLGLVIGIAPVAMLALSLPFLPRPGGTRVAVRWPEVTQNLGLLLVASIAAQGIANAGPIVLQILGGVDKAVAGRFLAAFVLVRLPLFFTVALQAAMLPRLVEASEVGDRAGFERLLRQLLLLVAGLGVVALVIFGLAGPQMISLLFGPGYAVSRVDLVVLALSSVLLLLGAMLQAAAVALQSHLAVAVSWGASGVVFVVGCLLPFSPFVRIEVAYVAAGVVVLVLLWLTLERAARSWDEPSPQPLTR
jgi:O-antigen/teichoic acid export membrane protein